MASFGVFSALLCRYRGRVQVEGHQTKSRPQVVTVTDEMTLKDLSRVLHVSATELEAKLAVLGETTESVEDMCEPFTHGIYCMMNC